MDLELSLKPKPKDEANDGELASLIARIETQYGAFREVTEESLLEELAKGPQSQEEDVEMSEGNAESEKEKEEKEKLMKETKQKIIDLVFAAQVEANSALDYVSLLISRYAPDMGSQAMTAELKGMVALGSLATEQISYEQPREEIEEDRQLARGWKIDGLRSASNALKSAAERLSTDATKESRFWEQVLKIQEEGWAISRVGKERALAVRYGFIEATNEFKHRGVSLLRRGDDGDIIVSEISSSAGKERTLRVRVMSGESVTGTSIAPKKASKSKLNDIIEKSRNSLWEEELFFEIMRESRSLAGYGVRASEREITLEIDEDRRAIVDMVPREDNVVDPAEESKADRGLATAIRLSLNLLLAQAHKFHLRKRSRPPPPLGQQTNQSSNLPLLRPIIVYISHQTALKSITNYLRRITALCKSTGFTANIELSPFKMLSEHPAKEDEISPLEPFLVPLESVASLHLPGDFTVSIQAKTLLGPIMPPTGTSTVFTTSISASEGGSLSHPKNTFTDAAELQAYILWVLEVALVRAIRLSDTSWEQTAQANEILKSVENSKSKNVRIMAESEHRLVVKVGYVGDPLSVDAVWDGRVQRDLKAHLNKNELS